MEQEYTVLQQIGENSTTNVYRAIRNCDGVPVVLKVFSLSAMAPHLLRQYKCPHSSVVKSVPSELVMLDRVQNISSCVKMLDYIDDSENGKWILVLEDLYAEGYSNLAQEIGECDEPMDEAVVSWILRELITVLDKLHSLGVLHCDIKPDNIFVDYEREKIKLIDFNLALESEPSSCNQIPGCTPEYAPPEVLIQRNTWTAAGEVWSVGCTAFVLLCRRFPFDNPWMCGFTDPTYPQCRSEVGSRFGVQGNRFGPMRFNGMLRTGTERTHQSRKKAGLSLKAKDFLLSCLSRSPEQRASLNRLSQHAFLALKAPPSCSVSNSDVLPTSPCAILVS